MKRNHCVTLVWLTVAVAPVGAGEPTKAARESLRYVASLKDASGGYRASASEQAPRVSATVACLRAIEHLGGEIADREPTKQFVLSCRDAETGGFADAPGRRPSVLYTALALMALAELNEQAAADKDRVLTYFARNVGDDEGAIYIATASLAAAGWKAPLAHRWIERVNETRNADGTFGSNVHATAGGVITLLRLGAEVKDRERVTDALKAAQRPDGGFSRTGASNLAVTYRVTRALRMLDSAPDIASCRDFVRRCRNTGGGYGVAPGEPSSASATYFAAIVLDWLREAERSAQGGQGLGDENLALTFGSCAVVARDGGGRLFAVRSPNGR